MISSETLDRLIKEQVISAYAQAFSLVLDNSNDSLAFLNLSWFTVTYVCMMSLHFFMNFKTNDAIVSKPLKVLKRLTVTISLTSILDSLLCF